ncbi:MAG: thioredoxin family protein [Spirochaetota bacterium]
MKVLFCIVLAVCISCNPQKEEKQQSDSLFRYSKVLRQAKLENKKILILFGADWCPDCKAMDRMLTEPDVQQIVESNYILMRVDVGRFDKNLDFAQKFGNPIAKGIPAFVILSNEEKVLVATNNGRFASARKMKKQAVADFLLAY